MEKGLLASWRNKKLKNSGLRIEFPEGYADNIYNTSLYRIWFFFDDPVTELPSCFISIKNLGISRPFHTYSKYYHCGIVPYPS